MRKWEREEDHPVPLVLGRDDLLLSAYLSCPANLSDTDTFTWRNCVPLRVRYSSTTTCPRGWSFSIMPSPTPSGRPPDLGRAAGSRSAAQSSAWSGAVAFSRLCYSARRTGTFTRSPDAADL